MQTPIQNQYDEILSREFRKAAACQPELYGLSWQRLTIEHDAEAEQIAIIVGNPELPDCIFVMQIGSDDDQFFFEDEADNQVEFPFPQDWPLK